MRKFNNLINDLNWMEIPLSNCRFSWSREGVAASKSLIDRFFVTSNWDEVFENPRVARQARIVSDHFPLLFEAGAFVWGPAPFKFCNSWLDNKECRRLIERTLEMDGQQGWPGFVIFAKLRNLKLALKRLALKLRKEQEK